MQAYSDPKRASERPMRVITQGETPVTHVEHNFPQTVPYGCSLVDDPYKTKVGDRVFCTVSGWRGWMIVTGVKGSHNDLRIKTDVFGRLWGYGHNFTRRPHDWML